MSVNYLDDDWLAVVLRLVNPAAVAQWLHVILIDVTAYLHQPGMLQLRVEFREFPQQLREMQL